MSEAHGRGRPLRFLLIVMLCWAGGRFAVSQDWADVPTQTGRMDMAGQSKPAKKPTHENSIQGDRIAAGSAAALAPASRHYTITHRDIAHDAIGEQPYAITASAPKDSAKVATTASFPSAPFIPDKPTPGRWSVSGWLFWRNAGGQASLASVGQLGGSQAGVRLAYQLIPTVPEKLAVYGRMTSALRRPNAPEAGIGLSFQPVTSIPLRVAVERRVALDHNARNAMAVMAVGGIGPLPLAAGITLEGYGQAGVVGFRSRDVFADGKLSLLHSVHDSLPLSAGIGLSGGAQPRVARFDIGPQIEAKVKLGDQSARLVAEWRQRVAGNARPGSGPALTLAADF